MSEQLMTVEQVADKLQISRLTLYSLINTGKITAVKFGRILRFQVAEIERFIEDSQTKNEPEEVQDTPATT